MKYLPCNNVTNIKKKCILIKRNIFSMSKKLEQSTVCKKKKLSTPKNSTYATGNTLQNRVLIMQRCSRAKQV